MEYRGELLKEPEMVEEDIKMILNNVKFASRAA
jgi:hypothetical protein